MAKNRLVGGMEGCISHDVHEIINHNFADISLCTTQLDMVTGTTGTTLTNVPGMVTDTLEPGVYRFRLQLRTVATANTGIKLALKWGTAAMITAQTYTAKAITASAIVTTDGSTATDATALLDSAAGVVILAEIEGVCTVAIAGTLQMQAAQHSAHADTTSVLINSKMEFTRIATN